MFAKKNGEEAVASPKKKEQPKYIESAMPVRRTPRPVGAKIVYKPNTNKKVDTNHTPL